MFLTGIFSTRKTVLSF